MEPTTGPSLTEVINRQLAREPTALLVGGVTVPSEMLWFWLAVELAPAASAQVKEQEFAEAG